MKFLFTVLLSFSLLSIAFSQKTSQEVPNLVIGTEAQVYFENLDYPGSTFGNFAYGLHVQKPIGRFTFGTGLLRQQFGQHRFREFTGETALEEDGDRLLYTYQIQKRNLNFWSIPLQAQFRLPCNCVYIHTALVGNFLNRQGSAPEDTFTEQRFDDPSTNPFFSSQSIRKASLGIQLGAGLNLHMSKHWKTTVRLIYAQYSFIDDSHQRYKSLGNTYLGLNAGLQYAIY